MKTKESVQTKEYIVTEKAGSTVAGRRVAKGDILTLTPSQAEYERLLGTIIEASAPQKEAAAEDMISAEEAKPARKTAVKAASKAD